MTRNQILKSQLYETAAHNRAMEAIASGELSERSRSNRQRENLESERNRITQQRYTVQNQVDLYNAETSRQQAYAQAQRNYYEHMDRVQNLSQRRKEWEQEMGKFYARLSFDYKKMELKDARKTKELSIMQQNSRTNSFASMGKTAVDIAKLAVPYVIPAVTPVNSAARVAKKLFK